MTLHDQSSTEEVCLHAGTGLADITIKTWAPTGTCCPNKKLYTTKLKIRLCSKQHKSNTKVSKTLKGARHYRCYDSCVSVFARS